MGKTNIKNKTTTKNKQIKVRVTNEQLESISVNAKKQNMNTSQYIRHCISADYLDLISRLPESIATSNLLNKIYHRLEGHTDPETLAEIRNYVMDYYNTGKGEYKNA